MFISFIATRYFFRTNHFIWIHSCNILLLNRTNRLQPLPVSSSISCRIQLVCSDNAWNWLRLHRWPNENRWGSGTVWYPTPVWSMIRRLELKSNATKSTLGMCSRSGVRCVRRPWTVINLPIFAARTCISYVSCSHCVILESCESFSPLASLMISVTKIYTNRRVSECHWRMNATAFQPELTKVIFHHNFTVFLQSCVVRF